MEKFKVIAVEELKTRIKQEPYKKLTLENMNGAVFEGVSAFAWKFPNQASLVAGAEIEGSIVIDGNYKNLVGGIEKKSNSNFKAQQIEKVMEKKSENIGKILDRKEESIRLASAQRDAVLLTTTLIANTPAGDIEEKEVRQMVIKWRNWFLLDQEFNNPPPF